ncbi:MAG: hypothetical protein WD181_06545 [Solirubrobacterales bacterium]
MPGRTLNSALLLGAIASIAIIFGCGGSRSNLVPDDAAQQIDDNLMLVDQLVSEGDCFGALDATEEARSEVEALGSDIDSNLKRNLLDGVTQLQIKVQENCEEADSPSTVEPLVPDEPAAESGTTDSEVPKQSPTGEGGAATTPEPTPAPAPTPPENGSGGVSPPSSGGVAPSAGSN